MKIFNRMSKKILALTAASMITSFSVNADTSVVVVANIDGESMSLSKQEIRNLFMGGLSHLDLKVVELPPMHEARVLFNTKVVGLTEARIQSYWAQMQFSGRKKPPKQLNDTSTVLAYLQENERAVAYLPADEPIPKGLTVLYTVN